MPQRWQDRQTACRRTPALSALKPGSDTAVVAHIAIIVTYNWLGHLTATCQPSCTFIACICGAMAFCVCVHFGLCCVSVCRHWTRLPGVRGPPSASIPTEYIAPAAQICRPHPSCLVLCARNATQQGEGVEAWAFRRLLLPRNQRPLDAFPFPLSEPFSQDPMRQCRCKSQAMDSGTIASFCFSNTPTRVRGQAG